MTSSDGRRGQRRIPKAFGGSGDGTNPGQLFAAGWASCFVGAVRRVAGVKKVKVDDAGEHRGHAGRDGRVRCPAREW
ncbi:OsmC family protein [Amycolatopsis orientalis]|uniref:OsmC family protein n=1 Tax=Amycolatopsis orientalis TaxID=31958 RepID=UPI0003FD3EEE